MSQLLSQKEDPIYISTSIAKFSHNTCPLGTRNFTWSHIGLRNDLDFTVRRTRVVDEHGNFNERLVMKISAGAELLENQDLGQLVQHCLAFDPSTGAEHPVQMVVKRPIFMAMRFPKNANNVRRIQVKFHNESDFIKALDIMQELGLPITDGVPPVRAPPAATPSPAPSSSTIRADSAFSVSRPASANSHASVSQRLDTPSLPALKSEFKVPVRPDISNSVAPRPHSALAYSYPSTSSISSIPRSVSTSSASSTLKHTSPSLYVAQIQKESQERPISLSSISEKPNEKHIKFPSKLDSPQEYTVSRSAESGSGLVSPFFLDRRPEIQHGEASQSSQNTASTSILFHQRHIWQGNLERPSSTPINSNYNKLTPSNNSVPFTSMTQTKVRAASVSILPPLPKPTPVPRTLSAIEPSEDSSENTATPTHKPAKKRVAQRKSTNSVPHGEDFTTEAPQQARPMKQPIVFEQPAEPEEEPSPLAAKSAPRPASAMAGLQSKAVPTKKRPTTPILPPSAAKRPKMVDQATQTQTLSGRDHTIARRPTPSNDAPSSVFAAAPASVVQEPAVVSPPESYLDAVDKFVSTHKTRPAPKELWQAPVYAEADEEQRQLLLNNFICDNLENADFLQLVQDTEKAWRRIGLGM